MSFTRCFTFGFCHAHPNGFVRITGPSKEWCRKEMFRRYKNKWAFEYSEEQIGAQMKRFPQLHEVPLDEPMERKFIVRYNVEFSREVEAESEQAAIDLCLKDENENHWDQRATSQYEAKEVTVVIEAGRSDGETEATR